MNPEIDKIDESNKKLVDAALPKVRAMFPDDWSVTIIQNIGLAGAKPIQILIFRKTEETKVTWHNSDVILHLMYHAPRYGSKHSMESIGGTRLRETKSKFRMISGKTAEEMMKKTVAWIAKFVQENPEFKKS